MKVDIYKSHESVVLPKIESDYAAAADIRANMLIGDRNEIPIGELCYKYISAHNRAGDEIVIKPDGRALIHTGIHVGIPKGYEIQVRPRSGLAIKNGISVLNTPGTIDCDYRGEVMVILVNNGTEEFRVCHQDRIAQLALRKTFTIEWEEYSSLNALGVTDRDQDGFGSTGK